MRIRLVFIVLAMFACGARPAYAIWERSESLEWWTSISQTVGVATIKEARLESRDDGRTSEQLTCGTPTFLKGSVDGPVQFSQLYWLGKQAGLGTEQPFKVGERALVFMARNSAGKLEGASWINLTHPSARLARHAPYDNDCNYVQDENKIRSLVKARIAKEGPNHVGQRGLLVQFKPMANSDLSWDFVRTADPEYKEVLVKELRTEYPDGRAAAIFNLASYPDADTIKLIRSYLNDPSAQETAPDRDGRSIRYYPARDAAQLALWVLGEDVKLPAKTEIHAMKPWNFEVGFEDPVYFPYGNWKRFPK